MATKYSTHVGFWTCWFQLHRFWGCTFSFFWVMGYMCALSWKLLIIGLLLEYFATLLKRLYLKKIAAKCSIFLQWFSSSRTFSWIKIKFHLGKAKGRGKGGMRGESQNEVDFLAKFHSLSEMQTLSHKVLVRQTSNCHLCNWHAQKAICGNVQVILSSSS